MTTTLPPHYFTVPLFHGLDAYAAHVAGLPSEDDVLDGVQEIISAVQAEGDQALLRYSKRFDGVEPERIAVSEFAMNEALAYLDPMIKDVWIEAINNIEHFHAKQKEQSALEFFDDGSILGWKVTPIDRVGIYIPGGTAVYSSSVLMNVIPAQIAGVPEIVLVSPPRENGLPHTDIMAAAALLGIEEMYAVGGVQAIAALAYGTESIAPVAFISGPGNRYVAEAKRQVMGDVGIDSLAGPSEILILCDQEGVNAEHLACDLLSQAEHDICARALLITTSAAQGQAVAQAVERRGSVSPRSEIIAGSFSSGSAVVVVDSLAEGIDFVNEVAPEHLELLTDDPLTTLTQIRNAGAIFLGPHTPEAVGDYFAGPNHTIPTGGNARFSSPLSVSHFLKKSSIIGYSPQRLKDQADKIIRFAEREQLPAHADAIRVRLSMSK